MVLGYLEYPVVKRNTIFCRCPGTSAESTSVNTTSEKEGALSICLEKPVVPVGKEEYL